VGRGEQLLLIANEKHLKADADLFKHINWERSAFVHHVHQSACLKCCCLGAGNQACPSADCAE
jgi:hypothetical protein